jgi:hypothetical protein
LAIERFFGPALELVGSKQPAIGEVGADVLEGDDAADAA